MYGSSLMHVKKITLVSVLTCSLLFSSACQQTAGNNSSTGALIGGVTGALAANHIGKGSGKVAATMLGAFAGAVIGSEIGQYMDSLDKQKANEAFTESTKAPVGRTITWNNPESGHSGSFKTVRDGTSSNGEYCREYQSKVTIGGKVENAYGTACRRPDGSWEIIKK